MNGKLTLLTLVFGLLGPMVYSQAPAPSPPAHESLLQFLDGSALHGQLEWIKGSTNLGWKHPASPNVIAFRTTNLSAINFPNFETAGRAAFKPSARIKFANGDELLANIHSLTSTQAVMETRFSTNLTCAKSAIQSLFFSNKGFTPLYAGFNGSDGWQFGRGTRSWQFRDGGFVANSPDTLGRNMRMTNSTITEFDLEWDGPFSLALSLYTDVLDRPDYTSSSYMFYIGLGGISVQRMGGGGGAMLLAQATIPQMPQLRKMHFEFRINKDDASITVLANGKVVQRARDAAGFMARGSGMLFFTQVDGVTVKVSNLLVTEWDGRGDAEDNSTNAPPKTDMALLGNKDKVAGTFEGIADGKVQMRIGANLLAIPIDRVVKVSLLNQATNQPPGGSAPALMQATFAGPERIGFNLQSWNASEVLATSPIFGSFTLAPTSIRQLIFNLHRNRAVTRDAMPMLDSLLEGGE